MDIVSLDINSKVLSYLWLPILIRMVAAFIVREGDRSFWMNQRLLGPYNVCFREAAHWHRIYCRQFTYYVRLRNTPYHRTENQKTSSGRREETVEHRTKKDTVSFSPQAPYIIFGVCPFLCRCPRPLPANPTNPVQYTDAAQYTDC